MAALRLPGIHAHHHMSGRALLAVILACAIASLAAVLAFLRPVDRAHAAFRRHATAVVRGAANPVMHYTAMSATIFTVDAAGLHVVCGDNRVVLIREIQAPGRKRLSAWQFLAGRGVAVGDVMSKPEVT